ncbi:MAG: hypothetical protein ACJ754_21280 [Pyrinomonadaceae bacterium]
MKNVTSCHPTTVKQRARGMTKSPISAPVRTARVVRAETRAAAALRSSSKRIRRCFRSGERCLSLPRGVIAAAGSGSHSPQLRQ